VGGLVVVVVFLFICNFYIVLGNEGGEGYGVVWCSFGMDERVNGLR
jgi:hypothetical protein